MSKNCISRSFLQIFLIQPSPIIPVTPRVLMPHSRCSILEWPVIFEEKWLHTLKCAKYWWDQDAISNRVFLRLVHCRHQLFSDGFTQLCMTLNKTLHRGDNRRAVIRAAGDEWGECKQVGLNKGYSSSLKSYWGIKLLVCFFFLRICIYVFMAALGLQCTAWASHHSGFSCRGAWVLGTGDFSSYTCGLSSCSTQT